jgi:hypothetical protein
MLLSVGAYAVEQSLRLIVGVSREIAFGKKGAAGIEF